MYTVALWAVIGYWWLIVYQWFINIIFMPLSFFQSSKIEPSLDWRRWCLLKMSWALLQFTAIPSNIIISTISLYHYTTGGKSLPDVFNHFLVEIEIFGRGPCYAGDQLKITMTDYMTVTCSTAVYNSCSPSVGHAVCCKHFL